MSLLRTNMGDIKKAQLPILRDKKITTFWDEKTQEGINIKLDNVEEN